MTCFERKRHAFTDRTVYVGQVPCACSIHPRCETGASVPRNAVRWPTTFTTKCSGERRDRGCSGDRRRLCDQIEVQDQSVVTPTVKAGIAPANFAMTDWESF